MLRPKPCSRSPRGATCCSRRARTWTTTRSWTRTRTRRGRACPLACSKSESGRDAHHPIVVDLPAFYRAARHACHAYRPPAHSCRWASPTWLPWPRGGGAPGRDGRPPGGWVSAPRPVTCNCSDARRTSAVSAQIGDAPCAGSRGPHAARRVPHCLVKVLDHRNAWRRCSLVTLGACSRAARSWARNDASAVSSGSAG